MSTERYTVDHGSNSGHCCFDSSVIDTHSERSRAVCECFDRDDAEKIAALLNGSVPVLTERVEDTPVGLGVVVK